MKVADDLTEKITMEQALLVAMSKKGEKKK